MASYAVLEDLSEVHVDEEQIMTETLKIELLIYRERLHVFFGTIAECQDAMRKDGEPEHKVNEWAEHIDEYRGMYSQNNGYRLIWLPVFPKSIDDYGCLVHEIWHAVFNILHAKGINHTPDSDEAYAYMAGYIYSEIDNYIATERDKEE